MTCCRPNVPVAVGAMKLEVLDHSPVDLSSTVSVRTAAVPTTPRTGASMVNVPGTGPVGKEDPCCTCRPERAPKWGRGRWANVAWAVADGLCAGTGATAG